jgi:Lrp/AsnC family leucine-responsive transcriptional regulator
LSKNSVETMKSDERKVLDILGQHAKENIDTLAKRCGFSRQKMWRIIKRLEKEKIIWGYSAITDGEANECKHFVLLVKRSMVSLDNSAKKEGSIETLDECIPGIMRIENILLVHGGYDYIFTFYASDIIGAKKFVQEISSRFGKYIDNYLLLETLFPIRKQGIKNPQLKNLVDYL